eukprot:TRINITY_DN20865_c0_g1_i1.p1 TRINITY_DN20865_c0_g1~~TRINITY_DN20865_c0_g1_i1.p1  ORF type:complete len:349 (+),score=80.25 TRINITY_DN20865_c0_g1_i1:146-1192(+)
MATTKEGWLSDEAVCVFFLLVLLPAAFFRVWWVQHNPLAVTALPGELESRILSCESPAHAQVAAENVLGACAERYTERSANGSDTRAVAAAIDAHLARLGVQAAEATAQLLDVLPGEAPQAIRRKGEANALIALEVDTLEQEIALCREELTFLASLWSFEFVQHIAKHAWEWLSFSLHVMWMGPLDGLVSYEVQSTWVYGVWRGVRALLLSPVGIVVAIMVLLWGLAVDLPMRMPVFVYRFARNTNEPAWLFTLLYFALACMASVCAAFAFRCYDRRDERAKKKEQVGGIGLFFGLSKHVASNMLSEGTHRWLRENFYTPTKKKNRARATPKNAPGAKTKAPRQKKYD